LACFSCILLVDAKKLVESFQSTLNRRSKERALVLQLFACQKLLPKKEVRMTKFYTAVLFLASLSTISLHAEHAIDSSVKTERPVIGEPVQMDLNRVTGVELNAILALISTGIINGREATGSDYSPVVMLKDDKRRCSGTIINNGCVLTARHCVPKEEDISKTYVYTGTSPWFSAARASQVIVSETSDLAVIKLDRDVKSSLSYSSKFLAESAPKIPKQDPKEKAKDDEYERLSLERPGLELVKVHRIPGTIVGFGNNDTEKVYGWNGDYYRNIGAGTKRIGEVRARHQPDSLISVVADPSMCASGDSGGPLFLEDEFGHMKLYGVAAAGLRHKGQDRSSHGGQYTSVLDNRKWIDDTLRRLGCK
jgi:V8-like Glu-specific endopeptidase